MNFYTIKESSSPKIIGPDYPQMECIDISVSDGLDDISILKGKRAAGIGKMFNLKLLPKAKLTDVISCSLGAGGDFIVNQKVYNILSELHCSSVQFFPVEFMYKDVQYTSFYYVHFVYELERYIDFKKSTYNDFFIKGINKNKPQDYPEFSKLVDLHKKYNHFSLKKTFLKQFPIDEDLFVLSFANQKKYISDRLCQIIKSENVTGIEVESASDIFE